MKSRENFSEIKVSVIIPVYKCGDGLNKVVHSLCASKAIKFFPILVVDGDEGQSLEDATELAQYYDNVQLVQLSKNYGQHVAIREGLKLCNRPLSVIMDGDGQDTPEQIMQMVSEIISDQHKNTDYILATRKSREEQYFRKLQSRLFYSVLSTLSGVKIRSDVGTFCIVKQHVKLALLKSSKRMLFVPLALNEIGFKRHEISFDRVARVSGNSSYTFKKLINLGILIVSHSTIRPLKIMSTISAFVSILMFLVVCFLFIAYVAGAITVPGWMSVIVVLLMSTSFSALGLSVIALYVASIYKQISAEEFTFTKPNETDGDGIFK